MGWSIDELRKEWENRSVEEILIEIDSARAALKEIMDYEDCEDSALYEYSKRKYIAELQSIVGEKTRNRVKSSASVADEIEKLYGLMKKGIITQLEFNLKKQHLLGGK